MQVESKRTMLQIAQDPLRNYGKLSLLILVNGGITGETRYAYVTLSLLCFFTNYKIVGGKRDQLGGFGNWSKRIRVKM